MDLMEEIVKPGDTINNLNQEQKTKMNEHFCHELKKSLFFPDPEVGDLLILHSWFPSRSPTFRR